MVESNRQIGGMTPEEHLANHLIRKYSLVPPIDVFEFASRFADIEELPFNLRGDAVLVEYPKGHRRPLIILNSSRKNLPRKRFSVSHEIGHIKIGWHFGNYTCNPSPMDSEDYKSGDYWAVEGEANRFAAEFLMPTEWVKDFVTQPRSVKSMFEGFVTATGVSYEAARIRLMKTLPPGYICVTQNSPGSPLRVESSLRTPSNLIFDYNDRSDIITLRERIERVASDSHIIAGLSRTIWLWRVDCSSSLPVTTDSRPSTVLMKVILEDVHLQPHLVVKASQRLNGLVGANNHSSTCNSCEEIYGILKLRFDKQDVVDGPLTSEFVRHKLFDSFLVNKAIELASGLNVKKKNKSRRKLGEPPNLMFE